MQEVTVIEPVLIEVKTMKTRWGCGRTRTYDLIKKGSIETRMSGGRRLIVDASVKRYFDLEDAA
ncbi:hypothetical protein A8B75_11560 [Sphingomonadales bacterium EhC05]|nr:hypothetical protein A8B75_11560 [Sphingomonadales bacterium EhC05]